MPDLAEGNTALPTPTPRATDFPMVEQHPAALGPLAAIAPLARRLLGGERASLLLPHDGLDKLRIASASGLPNVVLGHVQVRLGEPIAGMVAQTGEPLLGGRRDGGHARHAGRYRTDSFVSVPVPLGDGRNGVLSVADPRGRPMFLADDVEVLQHFALFVTHTLTEVPRQAAVRQRMIQAREDERRRVARELHDDAGHALTAAIFRLDLDALRLADDPVTARAAIERARTALLESAALLHDAAYALRPRILDDLGLLAALRSLATRAEEAGMHVSLGIMGVPQRLGEARELAVFRVVQEALTNIRKHARADHAWIWLRFEAELLTVIVEDDGIGLGPAAFVSPDQSISLGMSGMRERVEALGGGFVIGARPDGGVRLLAQLPLHEGAD